MNVATIEMKEWEARNKYKEYRAQVKKHQESRRADLKLQARAAGVALNQVRVKKSKLEKEDEALAASYRALSKGQKVLSLSATVRLAGLDVQGLPRIAISPAHAQHLFIRHYNRGEFEFRTSRNWSASHSEKVVVQNVLGEDWLSGDWRRKNNHPGLNNVRAVVPVIPPHLRPAKLDGYFIMWEPQWEALPPDPDPYLLSKINDDLFVVVAVWDMTPLELALLGGRRE